MENKQKIIISILLLLIIIGIVSGAYHYKINNSQPNTPAEIYTTKPTTTKSSSGEKKLLASLEDDDFNLYLKGETVILEHDGQSNSFTDWSENIALEKPEMYYADFDGDDKKELLIKIVSYTQDYPVKMNVYDLYILYPKKQDDGSYKYGIFVANRDAWRNQFGAEVKCNVNQLKADPSRIQVAMNNKDKSISYDENTGLATNGYVGYARAVEDKQGNYYNLEFWDKGDGIFSIEGNNIFVDIVVRARYENSDKGQLLGYIHCGLKLNGKVFSIKQNSVYFMAGEDYLVTDPRNTAKSSWSYKIQNYAGAPSARNKQIDWINQTFDLPKSGASERTSFSNMQSKIKYIDSVTISDKKIEMVAKNGFEFASSVIAAGNYSVLMNEGTDDEYKINAKAEINERDGESVLIINLDKSYPRDDIKTFSVKYGA